jgi:hypothetical protein
LTKEVNMTTNQLLSLLALFGAAAAWVAYAEHPTARNLRRAVIASLSV